MSPKDSRDEDRFIISGWFKDSAIALGLAFLSFFILSRSFIFSRPHKSFLVGVLLGHWALSEYFSRKKKLLLPSLVLVLSLTLFSYYFFISLEFLFFPESPLFLQMLMGGTRDTQSMSFTISQRIFSALGMAVPIGILVGYYVRFKLPFSLSLIMGAATIGSMTCLNIFFFPETVPLDIKHEVQFLMGCVAFVWAMKLEHRDPLGKTYQSDGAFWLHLFAGFLMAGAFIWTLFDLDLFIHKPFLHIFLVLLILFILGAISQIIHRPSLFVGGLLAYGFPTMLRAAWWLALLMQDFLEGLREIIRGVVFISAMLMFGP